MKSFLALFAVVAAAGSLHAADLSSRENIRNHTSPGSLESVNDIGCIPSSSLKNSHTPPDLYRGFAKCLAQDEFRKAAFMFMLAGAYARYDTMRVVDKSAHQAVPALRAQAVAAIANSRREAFRDTVKAMTANPAEQAALCREASRIGPPAYYPRYMVQHGLDAFISADAGASLKTGFDSGAAWKKVTADYLHCAAA
jgi:hypothetical protein